MKWIAALAILTFALATDSQLSARRASALFHSIEFVMVSDRPGSAVAFRLKKNHAEENAFVCFRFECEEVTERWQLLATDPRVRQKQPLMIEDSRHQYAFRRIALQNDIFTQMNLRVGARVAKLRLPASVTAKLDEEGQQIVSDRSDDQILFKSFSSRPWSTQWSLPLESAVTSPFGSLRLPPNGSAYSHTGSDLRALTGTKVRATSDGIVIQAEDHVIEGRVVTIDHGAGLMSRYAHLSEFKVKLGDLVKTGDVIGLSGSTGRSEAPHLHFEMRIRGQPVDPLSTQRLMARLSYLE